MGTRPSLGRPPHDAADLGRQAGLTGLALSDPPRRAQGLLQDEVQGLARGGGRALGHQAVPPGRCGILHKHHPLAGVLAEYGADVPDGPQGVGGGKGG